MSLNPTITPDVLGALWVHWTADPLAEGYRIVTPTGAATAGKTRTSAKLGTHASISVTVAPLYAQAAETAVYPVAVPPSGAIEWAGGYDPAWTGWDGAQTPGGSVCIQSVQARNVPGLPDYGLPADLWARFMVRPGDFSSATNHGSERAQLNNFTHTDGTEGKHGFWAWSTFFPADYNPQVTSMPQWNIFQQWQHQTFVGQGLFNFEVDASNKTVQVAHCYGNPSSPTSKKHQLGPCTPGKRYDFVFEVSWSVDPAKGFFQVWLDGNLVVPKVTVATLYQDSTQAFAVQNLYRQAHTTTDVLYQTGLRRASTYAAAAAGFP